MYERSYELRERPNALSPDPDYLCPRRVHREALDHLRYGLESQAGFVVVTGEIGSGRPRCCRRSCGAATTRRRSGVS